jgi:transposase
MTETALFEAALGIAKPWYIEGVNFEPGTGPLSQGTITIIIRFHKGSKFMGSDGLEYTVYDTRPRVWRHLNFFQHVCHIDAPSPRIQLESGKTETVEVPWARPGSQFTLLIEAFMMLLMKSEMTMAKVATIMDVSRDRVERVFEHYVKEAVSEMDCSAISALGIDETSVRKGHKYITVGVDIDTRKVVSVVEGRSAASVGALKADLEGKKVIGEQVNLLSMDMSPAYIKGAEEHFPEADVTFDKFHIVKLINEALDQTRRIEQAQCKGLKKTRYSWLGNNEKLDEATRQQLDALSRSYPRMGAAYRLKLQFNTFWQTDSAGQAEVFLKSWIAKAREIGNTPFDRLAKTLENHTQGILNHITFAINNGILEGINSKIQLAKRRARGYRNIQNFINMVYYLTADLKLSLPTLNK